LTRLDAWIRRWFGSRLLLVVVLLVCVGVPAFVISRTITLSPALSIIDEPEHLDYTTRLARGELPRLGDRLTQRQLREMACADVKGPGPRGLPSCDSRHFDADDFLSGAFQYEAHQPPAYYGLTTVMRFGTERVLGIDDYRDATRATGIVWMAAGLLALWLGGRLFRVDPWVMAAVLLLLALMPLPIYYSATVTNDAASLLAGGLAVCLAGVALRRPGARWVPWLLLGGGAFIALLKSTNIIAIVAVALLLLWEATHARPDGASWRDGVRPWLRTGGALLIGGALAVCAWAILTRARASIDPFDIPIYAKPLHLDRLEPVLLLRELGLVFSPGTGAYVPPFLTTENQAAFLAVGSGLLLAGGLAWIFVRPRAWSHVLGAAALMSIVTVSYALGVAFYLSYHADPALNGRYVLSATPVLAMALAGAARGRAATIGLWGFGVAFFVVQAQALLE
jgi:hypothetical protein